MAHYENGESRHCGSSIYFVDKCLPFGSSISCVLFQKFLDALKFLIEFKEKLVKDSVTNYLDDFLFLALYLARCNQIIESFLELCEELGVPITLNKTEWADVEVIFLGMLLNGQFLTISIPQEKKQ